MRDSKLRIVAAGGEENIAELKEGVPYYRNVAVEHDAINANGYESACIEVEMK